MIHNFKILGKYFLFDVESASFFEVDGLIYDIFSECGEALREYFDDTEGETPVYTRIAALADRYGAKELMPALEEIEELYRQGLIFTRAEVGRLEKSKEVKSLCLHICHDCNLSCEYCFAAKGTYHGEREYMSLETGKAAVDFLIANSGGRKNLEIDFFGGEPLMNLEAVKGIVAYAREREALSGKTFKFTLTTNGLLLDDRASDYLNREMENVVLSLDGRESVHNAMRKTVNGKDSFGLIIDKFKRFREARGDKSYYIRGTYTAANTDFSEDVRFMTDAGFDQISVEPVVLPPESPLALAEEHLPALFAEYEKLALLYLERKKEGRGFGFFHFNVDLDGGPCLRRRVTGCGAGSEYLAVSPKGELYPCHQFTGDCAYLLGNLSAGVINGELSDKFRDTTVYGKPDCAACWAKYLCSGGCYANSIRFGGGIEKTYRIGCELMKKRLECALYTHSFKE